MASEQFPGAAARGCAGKLDAAVRQGSYGGWREDAQAINCIVADVS